VTSVSCPAHGTAIATQKIARPRSRTCLHTIRAFTHGRFETGNVTMVE
jgi:hypothetical protein